MKKQKNTRSKYGANQCVIHGVKFDSQAEGKYYSYLLEQEVKGHIKCFNLQPKFILLPDFNHNGKKIKGITYKADFEVYHSDDTVEIVEIKGFETPDFKLRKKLFMNLYPYVRYSILAEAPKKFGGGFILLSDLEKLRSAERKAQNVTTKKAEQAATKQIKRNQSKRI